MRGEASYKIGQRGLGLVPEGRQVFPNLSVRENLVATAANRAGNSAPWTLERVFDLFPGLAQRASNMGSQLSGGEQQMLAVGRALMTNPKLRRPPLHRRTRPRRLAGRFGRTARQRGRPAHLSRGVSRLA